MPKMQQVHIRIPALVVYRILQHLDTQFIAHTCRFVNKEWNKECCQVLKGRVMVTFRTQEKVDRFCETFANANASLSLKINSFYFKERLPPWSLLDLREGLRKFGKIAGPHMRNLTMFALFPFPTSSTESQRRILAGGRLGAIAEFLFECCLNLEMLDLRIVLFTLPGFDPDLAENLVVAEDYTGRRVLPNLKILHFGYSAVTPYTRAQNESNGPDNTSEGEMCRAFMKSLMGVAPKLETFQIIVIGDNPRESNRMAVISPSLISNAKSLTFYNRSGLSTANLRKLMSLNCPNLEHLVLRINNKASLTDLTGFLSRHRKKLKVLEVNDHYGSKTTEFPPGKVVLYGLEELKLLYYMGTIKWENMPNLRKLQLNEVKFQPGGFFPSGVPRGWRLDDFRLSFRRTRNDLRSEGFCFLDVYPTITSPEIPLWFSTLSTLVINDVHVGKDGVLPVAAIFNRCRRLRRLEISAEVLPDMSLNDAVLCGLSSDVLSKVERACLGDPRKKKGISKKQTQKLIEVAREMDRSAPHIGYLTDLQVLRMTGNFAFTDYSVMFGIILCKKLIRLELNTNNLTQKSIDIIKHGMRRVVEVTIRAYVPNEKTTTSS